MLRLEIDGEWEPADFIELFESIESIYYKASPRAVHSRIWSERERFYYSDYYRPLRKGQPGQLESFETHLQQLNRWLVSEARLSVPGPERITVAAISYASPGSIDALGVGKTIEALDNTIGRLIGFFTERRKRIEGDKQAELETEIKRESLRSLQIRNAREILELRRDYRGEVEEILVPSLVEDQEKLVRRIAEGKLVGVKKIRHRTKRDPR
jgi:hypothetical protein